MHVPAPQLACPVPPLSAFFVGETARADAAGVVVVAIGGGGGIASAGAAEAEDIGVVAGVVVGLSGDAVAAGSARVHAVTIAVVPSAASVTARRSIERLGRISTECIRETDSAAPAIDGVWDRSDSSSP